MKSFTKKCAAYASISRTTTQRTTIDPAFSAMENLQGAATITSALHYRIRSCQILVTGKQQKRMGAKTRTRSGSAGGDMGLKDGTKAVKTAGVQSPCQPSNEEQSEQDPSSADQRTSSLPTRQLATRGDGPCLRHQVLPLAVALATPIALTGSGLRPGRKRFLCQLPL
jgi:hypothetical protein